MVTKIHVQAEKLKNDGYKIVVVGDASHPEVKGTLSHVPGAWCIEAGLRRSRSCRGPAGRGRRAVDVEQRNGFTDIVRALSAKYYDVRAVSNDRHRYAQPVRVEPLTSQKKFR